MFYTYYKYIYSNFIDQICKTKIVGSMEYFLNKYTKHSQIIIIIIKYVELILSLKHDIVSVRINIHLL